jgi:hypothetical protein
MEIETKDIARSERHRQLKMWVEYDRMEALAAFLSLLFATVEYESNYEELRKHHIYVPYASRTIIMLATLFTSIL